MNVTIRVFGLDGREWDITEVNDYQITSEILHIYDDKSRLVQVLHLRSILTFVIRYPVVPTIEL